jgi:hypothetical protein
MHQINLSLSAEEDYARLPEDLLAALLSSAPAVAEEVEDLLGPALRARQQLREAALSLGLIRTWSGGRTRTVAAVDGGFAVERTIAVDLVLSVAVGVEGFSPDRRSWEWDDNQHSLARHVLTHDMHNERLARAGMMIQELDVLADTPHDLMIFDGSHVTPVIALNSALASRSAPVRDAVAELADRHGLESALGTFVEDPRIVAMPKYSSSRELCDLLAKETGTEVPGDDKYLMSLILRDGEFTEPQQVPFDPWGLLHVRAHPEAASHIHALALSVQAKFEPLRERKIACLYFRPHQGASAYRIETKLPMAQDDEEIADLLASIHAQQMSPFVWEPYPQYLADVMAKSVGYAIQALQTATHLSLTHHTPDLADMVVHSYRTEGK